MARGPGFFAGLLVGAVVGAGAAILLAPKPGEQVRKELLESSGEWGGRIQDASELARVAADTLVQVSKDVVEQQRLRFQEAVKESREAAEQTTAEMLAEFEKNQRDQSDRA